MTDDTGISGRRLTRLRTLGRGASGAVVSLFAADGELLAVKSAGAAGAGAEQLRREGGILASLCSPYVLPCLGSRADAGGEYQLFLEFAPGGSLADVVERNGGSLEEGAVRAYAADVARGIAYLHGESMVHGDVKGRNVVIGADGWAKLADFGCARSVDSVGSIGGTPAFMAPEMARGEEQGPAADVWALGCTVIEMATGRAPWSDMDDVIAAVRLIGYTDAVPEAPEWLSEEAKDFLDKCFRRRACDRWTAAQLLEHPFLAFAGCSVEALETKAKWVSPKSTLDAAMWESDADDDDKTTDCTAARIRALASTYSAFPDWESDDGWIEVLSGQCELPAAVAETPVEKSHGEAPGSPVAATAAEETSYDACFRDEGLEAEVDIVELLDSGVHVGDELVHNVGVAEAFVNQKQEDIYSDPSSDPIVVRVDISDEDIVNSLPVPNFLYFFFSSVPSFSPTLCSYLRSELIILEIKTTNPNASFSDTCELDPASTFSRRMFSNRATGSGSETARRKYAPWNN